MKGTANAIETLFKVQGILQTAHQQVLREIQALDQNAQRFGFVADGATLADLDSINDALLAQLNTIRANRLHIAASELQPKIRAIGSLVDTMPIEELSEKLNTLILG